MYYFSNKKYICFKFENQYKIEQKYNVVVVVVVVEQIQWLQNDAPSEAIATYLEEVKQLVLHPNDIQKIHQNPTTHL